MDFAQCASMVNRALLHSCEKMRFAFLLGVLVLCGMMTALFRGVSLLIEAMGILTPSLLPFFIATGLLMAVSIPLLRMYHYQVTGKPYSVLGVIKASHQTMVFAFYTCIPLTIAYILTWVSLGLFMLLKELPIWGTFFGVLFSFFPFALVLSSTLFLLLCFFCCFFCAPMIALEGVTHLNEIVKLCFLRLRKDLFTHLVLFVIAIVPVGILVLLMLFSSIVTELLYYLEQTTIEGFLTSFFLILPAMLLLTPVFSFMFNFAYEAYVAMNHPQIKDPSE